MLNAAATIASAIIALAALSVSIIGLVRSNSASKDAQAARENATSAQWKMSEHLQAIAEAQAETARSATHPKSTGVGQVGGRLSARLVYGGRSHRLTIANVGTQTLTVEGIEVDPDDVLVGQGKAEIVGAELDPGEDFSLLAALTLGTKLPLTVTTRWRDASGAHHERVQKVTI